MLLAELAIRHTRRHMPTRRVALAASWLPTAGGGHGATLVGAVVAHHLAALDEDQRDELPALLAATKRGLDIPRIALRHRLQIDQHGLDRSLHRMVEQDGKLIIELDVHGAAVPQVLGACMAVAALPPTSRAAGLRVLRAAVDGRFRIASGVTVRLLDASSMGPVPLASVQWDRSMPKMEQQWVGVPADQRWAMEVLGLRADASLVTEEINRRFRRLVRQAHPDHGGRDDAAAERIAELTEARQMLLERAVAS